jgi:hypothetical protein
VDQIVLLAWGEEPEWLRWPALIAQPVRNALLNAARLIIPDDPASLREAAQYLLALQPNMQIRLHIVAPEERRKKVLREIKRPLFSLLEHGPLYEKCAFLSYDGVRAIADIKFLAHMSDTILDEYEEGAEE